MAASPDQKGKFRISKIALFSVACAILLIAGSVWFLYSLQEPEYDGRTLSEWSHAFIDSYGRQNEAAVSAIQHIGPRAIPFLLKWTRPPPEPSPLRAKIEDWVDEHTSFSFPSESVQDRTLEAIYGFYVLGPAATPAIPALAKALKDENRSKIAATCLALIGTNSIPAFTNALTSQNLNERRAALQGLGQLRELAQSAAPLVASLINDTNSIIQRRAILVLGEIGTARGLYPSLFRDMLLTSTNGDVAAFALGRLGFTRQLLIGLTNNSPTMSYICWQALGMRPDISLRDKHDPPAVMLFAQVLDEYTAITRPRSTYRDEAWVRSLLQDYLKSKDPILQAQAAEDLGFFGIKNFRAVPAVTAALSDTNELVRRSVSNALAKIDVQYYQGGIVRGPRRERKIVLEFTGHEFAESGETILDELEKHHAKASFFLTGDFLRNTNFVPLARRIAEEGHYLGPHSDKHLLYCSWGSAKQTLVSRAVFEQDLLKNEACIYDFTKTPSRLRKFWLPAYEWYNQEIADWSSSRGFALVNFTPGTRSNADYTQEGDTNFVSSQAIFDSIVRKEKEDPNGLNGFLLLMHLGAGPGRKDKMHARFGELLDYLSAKGYQFVRIDDLLDPKDK